MDKKQLEQLRHLLNLLHMEMDNADYDVHFEQIHEIISEVEGDIIEIN